MHGIRSQAHYKNLIVDFRIKKKNVQMLEIRQKRPWMWCPLPLPGKPIFRNLTFSKALDVVSIAPAGGTHFQKSDFFKMAIPKPVGMVIHTIS